MNVYIDGSGKPHNRTEEKRNQYFVLVGIGFDYNTDSEKECAEKIKEKMTEHGKVFHYSKDNYKTRIQFLESIKNCIFKFSAIVFWNDEKKYEKMGLNDVNDRYRFALLNVINSMIKIVPYPDIVIDKDIPEKYLEKTIPLLNKYVKEKVEVNRINSYKLKSLTEEPCLQLADYIAGIVRDSFFYKDNLKLQKQIIPYQGIITSKKHEIRAWNQEA